MKPKHPPSTHDTSERAPSDVVSSAKTSRLRRFLTTHASKKRLLIAGGVLLIVIIVALAYRPVSIYLSQDSRAASPTFEAVLPDDKMIQELGGWTRVSPPGNDPVFSYSDEIDGVAVSVSQQPIPASFAGNVPAQVEQLAKNYNATTVIETDDTKAYIGRSARGPQSVILTKNDVLILMQSEKTIDHSAWARYIETLTNLNDRPMSTF